MARRTTDVTLPVVLGAFGLLAATMAVTGGLARSEWRAELRRSDRVEIKLRPAEELGHWRAEYTFRLEELEGLERAHFSEADAPVEFEWRRDAGRLRFTGETGRRPRGRFSFEPDREFVRLWNDGGFVGLDQRDLYRLTIREITTEYVGGLQALGYRLLDADDIIRLDNHGMDLEHLDGMQALGYRASVDDLIRLASHGIDPRRVHEFAEVGLAGIPVDDLIRLRAHGIAIVDVRGFAELGYDELPVEDLIRLNNHGVAPSYVRELFDAGHTDLTVEELIRARTRGTIE